MTCFTRLGTICTPEVRFPNKRLAMPLIVINTRYGGFRLSEAAHTLYTQFTGIALPTLVDGHGIDRSDPVLVHIVQELGPKASGPWCHLTVIEVPDGVDWIICSHDGKEWVAERHRTWGAPPDKASPTSQKHST